MSIFSRLFKVGQASVGKVVDKLEKPELMLEQAIRDKEKQIRESKQAIQQCIATERQTKAMLEKEKSEKFAWEQKAEAAMRAGREDLAVKALERASEHEQRANGLLPNWESQRAAVDELKTEIQKMEGEIAEFKRNKDFIIAQSKAAQVKKDIYEAKARISKKDRSDDLMARMKEKAERQGYEADAAKELADVSSGATSLEDEFKDLGGAANPNVQAKLDALKSKLGATAN
ncbi:PspA/IM30 family protein [Sulfuriroseicoccus oceanibius]|uniref:PspA/IM30 family protein n=1 Tax=Sulfuriroseicoccus oceanibius TaxID=2707525 RepID=A0A6B3LDP9_9BACT|nr:PspA/IM30 family protein [Sulfuriroseicoccus oceanibius]QQL45677.1 PspA/IM30 family protein [Sulfuriroseicoccus oceanibius]